MFLSKIISAPFIFLLQIMMIYGDEACKEDVAASLGASFNNQNHGGGGTSELPKQTFSVDEAVLDQDTRCRRFECEQESKGMKPEILTRYFLSEEEGCPYLTINGHKERLHDVFLRYGYYRYGGDTGEAPNHFTVMNCFILPNPYEFSEIFYSMEKRQYLKRHDPSGEIEEPSIEEVYEMYHFDRFRTAVGSRLVTLFNEKCRVSHNFRWIGTSAIISSDSF